LVRQNVTPRNTDDCTKGNNLASNDDDQPVLPGIPPLPPVRRSASRVDPEMRRAIVELRRRGYIQSDIAAIVGTNQGRVSEVLNGKR
jgi:hypothetical protein